MAVFDINVNIWSIASKYKSDSRKQCLFFWWFSIQKVSSQLNVLPRKLLAEKTFLTHFGLQWTKPHKNPSGQFFSLNTILSGKT